MCDWPSAAALTPRELEALRWTMAGKTAWEVGAVLGKHFADVPGTRLPEVVTMLEEEKIQAYYGAGTLYAEPLRQEPLL